MERTVPPTTGAAWCNGATRRKPGQARPDGLIVDEVFRAGARPGEGSREPRDEIINKASGPTRRRGRQRKINGSRQREPGNRAKKGVFEPQGWRDPADGSTSSGRWTYVGALAAVLRTSRSAATPRVSGGLGWIWLRADLAATCASSCIVRKDGKPYPGTNASCGWTRRRSGGRDSTPTSRS